MHNIEYSFKKESVTVKYGTQYICFHSFYSKEKAPFRDFSRKLQKNQPQDLIKVIGMAQRRNIKSQGGYIPGATIIF